jgi:hypothetical protein
MIIANIYPIANQAHYKKEAVVMILAHLVKKGLYKPKSFSESSYIIMDNGLFEGEQVSTNLQDLIDLADNSGIKIDEIVIPDCMGNFEQTYKMFEESLPTIRKYQDRYRFMYVAHHKSLEELAVSFDLIGRYKELPICIGIPKYSKYRTGSAARDIYASSYNSIHFLGLSETFGNLSSVKHLVRSCDTSQLCIAAKYHHENSNILNYKRAKNEIIDLEHDVIDKSKLARVITKQKELYENGIL